MPLIAALPAIMAVAGTAASVAGGAMQGKANERAANSQNELDWMRYQDSRGANGSAILPLYAPEGTEKRLLEDALGVYGAGMGGRRPEEIMAEYQAILDRLQPSIDAGDDVLASIFNGTMLNDRLNTLRPVNDARLGFASSQRAAIDNALAEVIGRAQTDEMRKGYSGVGTFALNRAVDSTTKARVDAAMREASARYENALAEQQLREGMTDLSIRSLDAPVNRVGQRITAQQSPYMGVLSLDEARKQPLSMFNIGPGSAPRSNLVPQTSIGGLVTSGLGQAAGHVGDYYAKQEATKQQEKMFNEWMEVMRQQGRN